MQDIFTARVPHVYLIYGLAFFALGLAVALELGRAVDSRFKRALRPLVAFGLVHGVHEWFEMFELIGEEAYGFVAPHWLAWVRVLVLAFSFLSLGAFGLQMLHPPERRVDRDLWVGAGMLGLYVLGLLEIGVWQNWFVPDWLSAADAWTRYTLGIPGAWLAAAGLLVQRRRFVQEDLSQYASDLAWAATAFALYGAVGQFFTGPSPLFPSIAINTQWFLEVMGFPVQLFRALMATIVAVFTIRALRGFDVYRRRQLAAAQREAQEAIVKRDALRGELLRRSVAAQEEERRRLARELHDEIGQMLTGLATGLRGIQQSLNSDPSGRADSTEPSGRGSGRGLVAGSGHSLDRVRRQLGQMEGMTVRAIGELSHLVVDLRPSLLDDMGLHAALGWYIEDMNQRSSTHVDLIFEGSIRRLPPEVEIILFRITQESLSNVIRHAHAWHAAVRLSYEDRLARLCINDDGVGFDPAQVLEGEGRSAWGLVGIRERVQLAGGECEIESTPGAGTTITVQIPLSSCEEQDADGTHQVDVGG